MFKNSDEQDRWIKLRQQLLSAMGPVDRVPVEWREMLETLTAMAAPRRSYRFGRHVRETALPAPFRGLRGSQL
ncbi:MAG TPA: hypothetical protein VF509_04505 [Sphingobium sp.]